MVRGEEMAEELGTFKSCRRMQSVKGDSKARPRAAGPPKQQQADGLKRELCRQRVKE